MNEAEDGLESLSIRIVQEFNISCETEGEAEEEDASRYALAIAEVVEARLGPA